MATKKPLVITDGQIERLQPGDQLDLERTTTKTANGALPLFTAVYTQGGNATPAQADSQPTTRAIGLVQAAAADTDPVEVQVDGIMEGLTTEWDAVTGQTGGLTEGAQYYLSATTAGDITVTAPDAFGEFVVPIGVALSATELDIEIGAPIRL